MKVEPNYSRRTQNFGDTRTMRRPPRTAAAEGWSPWEPRRQAVCAVEDRAGEVKQGL